MSRRGRIAAIALVALCLAASNSVSAASARLLLDRIEARPLTEAEQKPPDQLICKRIRTQALPRRVCLTEAVWDSRRNNSQRLADHLEAQAIGEMSVPRTRR